MPGGSISSRRSEPTEELNRIMMAKRPSVGWKLLEETGLLKEFFPDLLSLKGVEDIEGQTHKDNFYHTLQVTDNLAATSDNLWLRWGSSAARHR